MYLLVYLEENCKVVDVIVIAITIVIIIVIVIIVIVAPRNPVIFCIVMIIFNQAHVE